MRCRRRHARQKRKESGTGDQCHPGPHVPEIRPGLPTADIPQFYARCRSISEVSLPDRDHRAAYRCAETRNSVRYRARATTSGRGIEIDCIPGGPIDWILRRRARTVYVHPGVDEARNAGWLLPTGRTPNRGMLDAIDQINPRRPPFGAAAVQGSLADDQRPPPRQPLATSGIVTRCQESGPG